MDCPPGQGITKKSPLTPSHGDSLADQSFQSFKSKEIRDSESPTKDMKFAQQQLHTVRDGSICVKPDTSGWNVVTAAEVNPDGTGYKTETLATTEGIRKIAGGQAEFAGKNEHMQKASHHGDDKNFVKTAAESSNTHLQESSVVGDENSGRIEKKSSTTVSSSSKSFVSKSTAGDDGGYDDYLTDSPANTLLNRRDSTQSNMSMNSNMSTQQQQRQLTLQEKLQQTRKNVESRSTTSVREEEHHHEQHQKQQEQRRYQEDVEQQNRRQHQQDERIIREQQHKQQVQEKSALSKDAQRYMTQYTDKEGVKYTKSPVINQDSPAELQREFERLETQPGRIISRTIEYPKPNLKMIVEKKELADGTIITSRNYETEGTPTVTETQQRVVSGSRKIEEGGSYKISITKGSTDDDQHQFTKNVDQRSRQVLRDTDRKLTNTNERNITNRTITSDEREKFEREQFDREFQQKRVNVNEDILNQDRINQTRQIVRDHEENVKKFNRIDMNNDKERYEREFQEWRNTNTDTVDRATISNVQQTAREKVENLKDQIETFQIHKTVKKDLSQSMRKENITLQDFIQTDSGCVLVDRNNISDRPEKLISTPTNQYDDCVRQNESYTSKNETRNIVRETEDDYPSRGQKSQKPEQDFTTHGFPSQRPDYDSTDTYTANERYENRTERIRKTEDFSTHGFPSVRDPTPKQPYDHSPTQSTSKQSMPEFTAPGRTSKDKPDFTTHGFPSARAPTEKKIIDHGPVRSPHEKKRDQGYTTHGFPSVRDPTPKKTVDHGPVRSPNSKQPSEDFSTHGFPSVRKPNDKIPSDHEYPTNKSSHDERSSQDFTTKNGFPAARDQTTSKRNEQVNIIEVKKSNQYQSSAQQKTTEKKTEMYTSTESLRREKKTDAAHDAFARSLRCASPVDTPRRDSNASQKSTSHRTHSIQTSRGSTPTYRAPTATSKLKTREVHQSNETIDLGSPHHHVDDLKRRGTSKITTTTTPRTTKASDSSGSPSTSPDRTNVRKGSQPNEKLSCSIERYDSPTSNKNTTEPLSQREPYYVPEYDSPKSKPTSVHPHLSSPERTTINKNKPQSSKIDKCDTTITVEDTTRDFEDISKPSRPKQPHYASPISKNTSKHTQSTSPERTTITRNDRNTKTNKFDAKITSEDITYDYEDVPEAARPQQPNYASSVPKNTSRHPQSTSPERTSITRDNLKTKSTKTDKFDSITNREDITCYDEDTTHPQYPDPKQPHYASPILKPVNRNPQSTTTETTTTIKDNLNTKTTKSNKVDTTITREDTTYDYEDVAVPSRPQQPHYASPISKTTSRHPHSKSPERTPITRDDLSTKTTKTNKFDTKSTREDITYDYEKISEPSRPQQPHYALPISKNISRYPQSTSPERTSTTRDNVKTKSTKTDKYHSITNSEDITCYEDDSSQSQGPKQPHYASPILKPTNRYLQSTSPEATTIIKDNVNTKTTKSNKVDTTITREDTTYDYEDVPVPSHPQQPHYASPISKSTSRHPQSTSPERTIITRDNLSTKTTKTNKFDTKNTREDITYDYEDVSEPSRPQQPHYALPVSKNTSRYPQSTSPERTSITRDNLKTKSTKTDKFGSIIDHEDITYDDEDSIQAPGPKQPHYASPISKPANRHPKSITPDTTTIITDNLSTKTFETTKLDSNIICDDTRNDCEVRFDSPQHREPHYASPESKATSRHQPSASPESTIVSEDNLTSETIIKNKFDSSTTHEDTTYDVETNFEPLYSQQPHYASPIAKPINKHPQSTSPERTTIAKTYKTNKIEDTVTLEDITCVDEDSFEESSHRQPHLDSIMSKPTLRYPQPTSSKPKIITRDDVTTKTDKSYTRDKNLESHQKSKPRSNTSQSKSPDRITSTSKDSTTNTIIRHTTTNTLDECRISDDEGIEPESPRSGSPTSDFEYRRNIAKKSKQFTTDLDSENIYIEDIRNKTLQTCKDKVNTEFIIREKENVYRETSPVHDKYRPRSTTQEYFDETEKIENMRYPSSKSPEGNKPKEPFFLRGSPDYEELDNKEPGESKPKPKSPFNRSETFEERCRQVLGINEHIEINESVTNKHKKTSDLIDNENNFEDIKTITKSSSPSPVPSPRSSSPRKTTLKQDHINETHEKFMKHEKESITEKDYVNRSVSPGYSPTRKFSPQKPGQIQSNQDISHATKTKLTTRQQGYSSSPKNTPTGSPYTRSPVCSPVRTSSNRPRSPDKISKTTSTLDYNAQSYTTSEDNKLVREQSPENQTHITVAKIKISPSTPKTYIPETNLEKPQKPKSSPVNHINTTASNRTTTKANTPKDSPYNNRPNDPTTTKKTVPIIHKRSDTEYDKESDIVSDNEDITTTTTRITKTTTKKSTPNKKLPVTERKESAPVYRTTHLDRDQKMTRSTSDNILKTQKRIKPSESEKPHLGPRSTRKTSLENKKDLKTERRPSKCLTTKTINLSTKNNIINSEDMENVIIDIQQAKSSREPSPNKMIPIPVPLNEDTGKPRYPDKVQEPEEDRRRVRVKNVPIYEEAKDDFIGCQITEVGETEEERLKTKHLSRKLFKDENTTIQTSTKIDRNTTTDENCLLSVHDKVSKFINTAEEVKKPKPSVPFQRDVPQMNFPEDDDCLLSVNDKVNKFLTTAEKITKDVITSTGKIIERVNLDEIDKNLYEDECILSVSQKVNKFINTAEKLSETQPQKSPELVARIEKQISRQSDDDHNEEEVVNTKATKIKSRITERYTPDKPKREPIKSTTKPVIKATDVVRKAKSVFEKNEIKDVKLSKTTTNAKQRDILSRPSVWETQKKETIENRKNLKNRDGSDCIKSIKTTKPLSVSRDSERIKSDIYDNSIITSKTELSTKAEDVTSRLTRKTTPRRPVDTQSSRYPDKKTQTVDTKSEYSEEYSNKFGQRRPKDHSPNRSPHRETLSPKHPVESKTEYTDEYTNKYGYTEKNIDKKISSSSITTEQRSPEQSPTRVSGKLTEFPNTSSVSKPESYSPSWSRNKQPKQHSPTRLDNDSPNRLTTSYIEETTSYSTNKTKEDHSPTRPSPRPVLTQPNRYPDDHSPARSINRYTETQKTYRTSGTPSPSILDRKYLFENIEPSTPRPSYMDHTKASLEHIRRDSLEINRSSYNRRVSVDEESFDGNPRSSVKFGVDLKHHDESKPRRKSSSPDIPHIEEMFDLNLLEQMLSVVVGYEQRRRIRSQIRIVKKMIEEETKEEAQIAYIRETSPARRSGSSERENSISSITRENIRNKTADEQLAYIRETSPARRSSPTRSVTSISSQKKNIRKKSSSSFIERESKHMETLETTRDRSPQSKMKISTTVTEFKKAGEKPINKIKTVPLRDSKIDEKPIWATKNILKKPSENNPGIKSNTTKKSHTSISKTTQSQRQKISTDEDCITSSYGIGPTDEDGRPLFGIRALKKKQQPSESNKVTGTVVTENFYSENGSAPVGERKITVYSSNPNDIDEYESKFDHTKRSGSIKRESAKQNGLTSVTRTQKFGDPIDDSQYPALTDDLTTTNKKSKVIRKGSVKEMSEKFIRKESSSSVTEKTTSTSSASYPKAGLILRTTRTDRESTPTGQISYDNDVNEYDYEYDSSKRHSQLVNESESENESCEVTRTVNKSSKSFLNSTGSKITGVGDVLERMRNADKVIEDGDTLEDQEARALLNKFLGASVLMSGVESMVPREVVTTKIIRGGSPGCTQKVKTTRVTKTIKTEGSSSSPVAQQTCDIEEIWDIEFLKELLEQTTSYEERSKIRARIKKLMAEREESTTSETTKTKNEDGSVVTTTTKVTTRTVSSGSTTVPKQVSPFAKFKQLDKQNSLTSQNSPKTPITPGGANRGAPIFAFTDPTVAARAATAKEQLLHWCQMKTKEYENIQITNFSTSWNDGMAFCALIHHFLPDAFDYTKLTPKQRRYNFTLAFRVADEKAGIAPLLDVEDMVVMKRPDWKCVFTYVQSIHRHFRNCQ